MIDATTGEYLLGAIGKVTAVNYKNGVDGGTADTQTITSHGWWESAVQSSISHDTDTGSASNPLYATTHSYNGLGQLSSATIGDTRARNVSFTLDELGQIIRRDEADGSSGGDPHEVWYRFAGKQMGAIGNNGTGDMGYDASLAERQLVPQATPGPFRNGASYGMGYADFSGSHDPINSYGQSSGGSGGSYTVREGDTLQSIAAGLYGDAGLWYRLAESNGLSASSQLSAGQSLSLPTGVMRSGHNASTFSPYNPADAIGDLTPATAKPPKKGNKCGAMGQVIMIAVAVAVTALTQGGAAGFAASLLGGGTTAGSFGAVAIGGALAGAAGSIASQAFGVATGIQDKFSFKGVAMAALSGAVGGGLGKLIPAGAVGGSSFITDVVRGALSSATTQGVGVATGLQKSFSWTGVAAAGVASGVVGLANRGLADAGIGVAANAIDNATARNVGFYANQALSGMAGAIAGGATRSLITGTGFGDNVIATLPDVIGATIGNLVGDGINGRTFGPTMPTQAEGAMMAAAERAQYWLAATRPGMMRGVSTVQYNDRAVMSGYEGGGTTATQSYEADGTIVVSGIRQNTGQSIFDRISSAASGLYNNDFIGNNSLSDLVSGTQNRLDRFSRSASNWLDVQLRTLEQTARFMPVGDRIKMIASGNFAHSLAKVVVSVPSAIAHPVDTIKAPFIAAAQGVDGALAINAIPARKYVPEQLARLRNVTIDDVARAAGKTSAALLPTRLLPSARFAPEVKVGGAESISSPSALARLQQGDAFYPGVDRFRDITLKPGTSVFVGEPGVRGFATTRGAFGRTGTDAQRIFEGLQVAPRNGTYRPGLTEYVITQETRAAFGIVRANPQYGSGGLSQLYIPNFSEVARPVVGYPLTNTITRIPK